MQLVAGFLLLFDESGDTLLRAADLDRLSSYLETITNSRGLSREVHRDTRTRS